MYIFSGKPDFISSITLYPPLLAYLSSFSNPSL